MPAMMMKATRITAFGIHGLMVYESPSPGVAKASGWQMRWLRPKQRFAFDPAEGDLS